MNITHPNTTTPYILGFFDRGLQRLKNVINRSWMIKNPHNLPLNIAQSIHHSIETVSDANSASLENPKIIRQTREASAKAEKILEIAKQLLKIRETKSQEPKASLEECIQHVCSYAFSGWMWDKDKKKISHEINRLLSQNENKPSENTLKNSSKEEIVASANPSNKNRPLETAHSGDPMSAGESKKAKKNRKQRKFFCNKRSNWVCRTLFFKNMKIAISIRKAKS